MTREKVIPRNVTLFESDLATLRQVSKDNGLASMSAALRYIINDWKKLKAQQANALAESRVRYEAGPER
jgi:hypothetical protein